jgi:hypothetical protein
VVTACPLLAAHLTALHPGLRSALLTRLASIGTLRDRDGLLLLTHHDPAAAAPGNGLVTTTIYLGTNLDDADVWARAVKLRVREVLVLPDQDAQLVALLIEHVSATA